MWPSLPDPSRPGQTRHTSLNEALASCGLRGSGRRCWATSPCRHVASPARGREPVDIHYAAQVYFDGAGIDAKTDPGILKFVASYKRLFGMFPEQANAPGAYQTFMAINAALQHKDVVDARSAAAGIQAEQPARLRGHAQPLAGRLRRVGPDHGQA